MKRVGRVSQLCRFGSSKLDESLVLVGLIELNKWLMLARVDKMG